MTEAADAIGAGRYGRGEACVTERPRLLATQARDVRLEDPRAAQRQLLAVDA